MSLARRQRKGRLPTLQVAVVATDGFGRILDVSANWKRFLGDENARIPCAGVGLPYGTFWRGGNHQPVQLLQHLLSGEIENFFVISPWAGARWIAVIGIPKTEHARDGAILLHIDLSDVVPHGVLAHQHNATRLDLRRASNRMAPTYDSTTIDPSGWNHLNERQRKILRLLAEGKTNKEIALVLHRSPNTIKQQLSALMRLLNVKSRIQAALYGSR